MNILLIEDNEVDKEVVKLAVSLCNYDCSVYVVSNADEAYSYLKHTSSNTAKNYPDVALIDLKMPGGSGYQFIKQVAEDKSLPQFLKVILSACFDEDDLQKIKKGVVDDILTKPDNLDDYIKIINDLCVKYYQDNITADDG